MTSGSSGSRCSTGGNLPCLTSSATAGASAYFFGNWAGSVTMVGPSSLPINCRPGLFAAPAAAGVSAAPAAWVAAGGCLVSVWLAGGAVGAAGPHAANAAPIMAAVAAFNTSRRLIVKGRGFRAINYLPLAALLRWRSAVAPACYQASPIICLTCSAATTLSRLRTPSALPHQAHHSQQSTIERPGTPSGGPSPRGRWTGSGAG